MAKIINEVINRAGGKEKQMDLIAKILIVLGIVSFLYFFVSFFKEEEPFIKPIWMTFAFAALLQGIIFYVVFSAGAEIIRLLKKQNNLPFNGKISGPSDVLTLIINYRCSDCSSLVEKIPKNVIIAMLNFLKTRFYLINLRQT